MRFLLLHQQPSYLHRVVGVVEAEHQLEYLVVAVVVVRVLLALPVQVDQEIQETTTQ
jgi:hypothetical protein